jgi:NAD(P)-dependent dehydrogenase (short-subunit alcohol dehydrogenase family)
MTKWTTADIPDQTGRVAVITGANTGLGYETAAALAAKGARVVLAVRNLDKGQAAAELITRRTPGAEVSLQELDLTSLESIRAAADQLNSNLPTIDLLINNAGVMFTPKSSTKDGFELQFGTNHLGHFALTGLLLDHVLAAPDSRVVTVSSVGHRFARNGIRFDDLQWDREYSRVGAYGQAKLANLLFTYELQRRLRGTNTIATAAHPGGSKTELTRNLPPLVAAVSKLAEPFFQDADMGALPTLRAATDPDVLGGQYYGPDGFGEQRGFPKIVASSGASHDTEAQHRLWTVSEELTGVVYPSVDRRAPSNSS